MKSRIQQLSTNFAQGFGFIVLALVIAAQSCRFNRVKAQDGEGDHGVIVKTNWCNQAYYEATYGADWHIYWAAHFCWLYTNAAPTGKPMKPMKPTTLPMRLAVRGR